MLFVLASFGLSLNAGGGSGVTTYGTTFIHKAKASNRSCLANSCTIINHPLTNNNPSAVLFVTQLGNLNTHEAGVQYNGTRWVITNIDQSAMAVNAQFFVWVTDDVATIHAHTATNANTGGNFTVIDNALLNGQGNRIVAITPNLPAGSARNKHNTGVWYNGSNWKIFNQDSEAMKVKSSYNVVSFGVSPPRFTHVVTAENDTANGTILDHPDLNLNPNARFIVTQSWTNGGADTNVYNDRAIGVQYVGDHWEIVSATEVPTLLPLGAAFNVIVLEAPFGANALLLNGGFEVSGGAAAKAALWAGATSSRAKRVCTTGVSSTGGCALQLKGGATPVMFTQTISKPNVGSANELSFFAYVDTLDLTAQATITIILKYQGGGSDKLIVGSGDTTAPYHYITDTIVPDTTVSEILVRIKMPSATGRIRVDSMHLLKYLIIVPLPPAADGD